MATLAFNAEEITARELKPSLFELDGISRETVEAHYKLYQGYIAKRNEILDKLASVDMGSANQVYSEVRALKVDLSFAVGGVKNHEVYFEHLGGYGGDPDGPMGALIKRDFGSLEAWRADLKATGMAGRGWAWTVYEHAYFIDYGTDRASYIDAFFNNVDWATINDWVSKYQIPLK